MVRSLLAVIVGISSIAGFSDRASLAAGPEETRTFELHAVPPPPMAGSVHQLLVEPRDMRPGDAAVPLMRAALMLSSATEQEIGNASDRIDRDPKAFDTLAKPIVDHFHHYVDLLADAAYR